MTTDHRLRFTRLALTAATAALLVGGCAMDGSGARPSRYAAKAEGALARGKVAKAVTLAEQAVLAAPRDAGYRAMLGAAYLKVGRFASATEAYDAALELGDESVPTVLGLALAEIAQGHNAAALELLNDWHDLIPAGDLGLGYALAGNPERGVAILTDAVRAGDGAAKTRQNLAFAYALAGRWREARLMIAQDVPADKVDARVREWALMAMGGATGGRVAQLLGVPVVTDGGQPAALALANFPAPEQLAAEAAAPAVPEAPAPLEALAVAEPLAAPVATPVAEPAAEPAVALAVAADPAAKEDPAPAPLIQLAALDVPAGIMSGDGPRFSATPVIQALPAPSVPVARPIAAALTMAAVKPRIVGSFVPRSAPVEAGKGRSRTPARVAVALPRVVANGAYWVQLGSYTDPAVAEDGWHKFTSRTPALKPYRMKTTTAVVDGTNVWRVAAAGFADYDAAALMCRAVKGKGGGCLVVNAAKAMASGSLAMAGR